MQTFRPKCRAETPAVFLLLFVGYLLTKENVFLYMTSVVSVYVDPWLCLFLGLKTHSFYQLPKKYLKRLKKQFATAVNKRETDGWCFFFSCADYGPLWRPVNFLRLSSFFSFAE